MNSSIDNGTSFHSTEKSRLLENDRHQSPAATSTNLTTLFEGPPVDKNEHKPPADASSPIIQYNHSNVEAAKKQEHLITQDTVKSTLIGSVVFLLYHVVFCLAQAAAIPRPHSTESSSMGVLARTAALGVFTAGPVFLLTLGDTIPAIYPASDLFLAPFLAQLATSIDQVLYEYGLENDHDIFFATFGLVVSTSLLISGLLSVLAARVKLANLGAFLPYTVLCGFFSAIGVLMWTLGVSVDVGQTIGQILSSGDLSVLSHAALHHLPSFLVGILMHRLGPKNPLFVIGLVLLTILGSYIALFVSNTSLKQAQDLGWFFSPQDLVSPLRQDEFGPPLPFGMWISVAKGNVHWEAYKACLPTVLSLACLYLIRCSLHSAALKKNGAYLTKKFASNRKAEKADGGHSPITSSERTIRMGVASPSTSKLSSGRSSTKRKAKPITLNTILENGYGYSQLVAAFVGGITVAPSVAASETLFQLGAEKAPPQYGSCLLVLLFYCTNFSLVQFIPKPAFSSLMVLAGHMFNVALFVLL